MLKAQVIELAAFLKTEFCSKPMIRNSSYGFEIYREPPMV